MNGMARVVGHGRAGMARVVGHGRAASYIFIPTYDGLRCTMQCG